MRSDDRVLDVIHTTRQKRMHLGILTPKQLEPTYRDIQDNYREVTFPIPESHVDTDELTSLSTLIPIYKNGALKILLDTLILKRNNYLAYTINTVPVPQAI